MDIKPPSNVAIAREIEFARSNINSAIATLTFLKHILPNEPENLFTISSLEQEITNLRMISEHSLKDMQEARLK